MALGNSGEFILRNSVFVPGKQDHLIYEMPDFQRPLAWLKGNQPSKGTMLTPQPISNGLNCSHDPDGGPLLGSTDLELVEPSRFLTDAPQCQWSRKSGPNDRQLLPSQRLRARDTDVRVYPTNNPYHWEAAQSRNSNISTWVKASWTRTNEIVWQRAGILNRKAPVRRSRNNSNRLKGNGTTDRAPTRRSTAKFTFHRAFSFELEEPQEYPYTALKDIEEEDVLAKTITRVDSGVLPPSATRPTRFHEELEKQPTIAHTFSEILGGEQFVPTALLEET